MHTIKKNMTKQRILLIIYGLMMVCFYGMEPSKTNGDWNYDSDALSDHLLNQRKFNYQDMLVQQIIKNKDNRYILVDKNIIWHYVSLLNNKKIQKIKNHQLTIQDITNQQEAYGIELQLKEIEQKKSLLDNRRKFLEKKLMKFQTEKILMAQSEQINIKDIINELEQSNKEKEFAKKLAQQAIETRENTIKEISQKNDDNKKFSLITAFNCKNK